MSILSDVPPPDLSDRPTVPESETIKTPWVQESKDSTNTLDKIDYTNVTSRGNKVLNDSVVTGGEKTSCGVSTSNYCKAKILKKLDDNLVKDERLYESDTFDLAILGCKNKDEKVMDSAEKALKHPKRWHYLPFQDVMQAIAEKYLPTSADPLTTPATKPKDQWPRPSSSKNRRIIIHGYHTIRTILPATPRAYGLWNTKLHAHQIGGQ